MAVATDQEVYVIDEVVHFGGFFQGETVGLNAHPLAGGESRSLTIDDHCWENLKDKHALQPGMALLLRFSLGEVTEAAVLGHADRALLREAIKERNISPNPQVRAIAYNCKSCGMWIAREPEQHNGSYACSVCSTPLAG